MGRRVVGIVEMPVFDVRPRFVKEPRGRTHLLFASNSRSDRRQNARAKIGGGYFRVVVPGNKPKLATVVEMFSECTANDRVSSENFGDALFAGHSIRLGRKVEKITRENDPVAALPIYK